MFYIIGVGRSGTSLLQSILTSHSQIAIPPETGFVRGQVLSHKNKEERGDFQDYCVQNPKLERIKSVFEEDPAKTYASPLAFYQDFLTRYLQEDNKALIGDKDPRLVEYVTGVSSLFPEAKFIHLIRDPRDVLLSKKKAAWSKSKPSWYHIFANYIQLKLGEQQGGKLGQERYLSLIYEQLLENPEKTAKRVCDFLNVSYEKEMLSFQDKAKKLVSEEEKQWKKETFGPLLKNNSGKWKGKLSNQEVALTECLCKQAFQLGGYHKSNAFKSLSFGARIKVKSQVYFFKITGIFYSQYRLRSQRK